ncbi:MAG: transporter substrate-binding domain-containing protein [bacterium]
MARRVAAAVRYLSLLVLACAPGPAVHGPVNLPPLRVVVGPAPTPLIPGLSGDSERDIAWGLAARTGRELELITLAPGEDPLPRLLDGRADLVATGLAASTAHGDRIAFSLPYRHEDHPVVLAMRAEDVALRGSVNEILLSLAFSDGEEIRHDDLSGIRRRGSLRFIARPHPASYCLRDGDPSGFEYGLLRRFADEQGLALEIVTPRSPAELESWLLSGRGDVLAASPEGPVPASERLRLTRSVADVDMAVVTRDDDARPVHELGDLAGRTLAVRTSGSERALAEHVAAAVEGLKIQLIPDGTSLVQILAGVGDGQYDATLAPTHLVRIEKMSGRRLDGSLTLGSARLGWGVRAENPALLAALNQFLAREIGGADYNMLWRTCFADEQAGGSDDADGQISPYDALARRYALQCDLDWRLIVAQMFQESRFDPQLVSPAGATGLMQMTPDTAARLEVGNQSDPEESIRAGSSYLRRLIDLYEPTLPLATRIRFALAAYDAGPGHVLDARTLAQARGLDPNRWYGNVEKAMLLLEQPEYFMQAKCGRCRGSEVVRYVEEIDRRYRLYVQHVPDAPGSALRFDAVASLPAGPASPIPPA